MGNNSGVQRRLCAHHFLQANSEQHECWRGLDSSFLECVESPEAPYGFGFHFGANFLKYGLYSA